MDVSVVRWPVTVVYVTFGYRLFGEYIYTRASVGSLLLSGRIRMCGDSRAAWHTYFALTPCVRHTLTCFNMYTLSYPWTSIPILVETYVTLHFGLYASGYMHGGAGLESYICAYLSGWVYLVA